MANPQRAWKRLLELIEDRREEDVNMLATFCIELERTVVNPLRTRVDTLEQKIQKLESELREGAEV